MQLQHIILVPSNIHSKQINRKDLSEKLQIEIRRVETFKNNKWGTNNLACEQALWAALAVGWKKKGELTTTSLEFEFHLQFLCGSPSTELSDFQQSA